MTFQRSIRGFAYPGYDKLQFSGKVPEFVLITEGIRRINELLLGKPN